MKQTNLQKICLCAAILAALSFSCAKEREQTIPSVYVNFSINILTDPEFLFLRAPGNSQSIEYHTLGVSTLGYDNNGILIYNAGDDDFYAFDCTCPYDFPTSVAVVAESSNAVAECPVCHTRYVLPSSGLPSLDGPGEYPLKEYRTAYNPNTGELQVFN